MSPDVTPPPVPDPAPQADDDHVAELRRDLVGKLAYSVGKDPAVACPRDWYMAAALTVRDRIVDRWFPSTRRMYREKRKRVYYLSLEFLIGRLLKDSLHALDLIAPMRTALRDVGVELEELYDQEPDAALGNGGLGRLAACFMESMATLEIAAFGYGIRYDHGLFRQKISDGWQSEVPEDWLQLGNPWEFQRPEVVYGIGFGGAVQAVPAADGKLVFRWKPAELIEALAYDTPMLGYGGRHVNTLRLWRSRAQDPLSLDAFNRGDHTGAFHEQARAAAISQVLYPAADNPAGEELRLRQEYFFSSAALQDIVHRHLREHGDLDSLADHVAIQLNDTHPAIAIPELMRILVDLHGVDWAQAWDITVRTFSYTNHTLLPEALEHWGVPLMERLLPRHMQIIYLINAHLLDSLRESGAMTEGEQSVVSLIDETGGRQVRMGWLSFVGSHKINGVSALHTELMKQTVFSTFHRLYPDRIVNKTNGITFRRWLMVANEGLADLLDETVGPRVREDASLLVDFARFADDASVHDRLRAIRLGHKRHLCRIIHERLGIAVDPTALFDTHIKRMHEYKRQLLNILETIALYDAMRAQPTRDWVPRVKIFSGKAAASYHTAKLIIKLINDVAATVNVDPSIRGKLKIVFLPDYKVSLAERIIPASDLSEQISTAGMEASGTGNMKFALNGALTIGTLDGANVEIKEHVGDDNIFIFGLTAEEVAVRRSHGIDARETIAASPVLREVLQSIADGAFSPDDRDRYASLVDILTYHDHFLVTADFDAYVEAQAAVSRRWRDRKSWWRSAILNTARTGWFSSDRTIAEYAEDIWKVPVRQS